jgi:hypothetical protein
MRTAAMRADLVEPAPANDNSGSRRSAKMGFSFCGACLPGRVRSCDLQLKRASKKS